jgi:hypothetical protein
VTRDNETAQRKEGLVLQPLRELIPGWPDTAPQDGPSLVMCADADLADLGLTPAQLEQVRALRSHLHSAAIARGQSKQLGSADAVYDALVNRDIRSTPGRWKTWVLDSARRRVFTATRADSSRTVERVTRFVPEPGELPTLPDGGTYLVLWGGDPDVLRFDDVRGRLRTLITTVPVADVLFHDTRRGALFSLRNRIGAAGRQPVEFPDPDLVKEVWSW